MKRVQKTARVDVVVDASPEQVWQVVSDPTRIGEWSHECRSGRWLSGAAGPVPGARFRNRNRAGWVRWSRTSELVTVDEPRELIWRTVPTTLYPDSTEWRLSLERLDTGSTRVTQCFRVLRAPRLLDPVYARLLPSHQHRDARLAEDLERLGPAARRLTRPGTGAGPE